jgi:hypothetical protein
METPEGELLILEKKTTNDKRNKQRNHEIHTVMQDSH